MATLQARLQSLITAIGADIKSLTTGQATKLGGGSSHTLVAVSGFTATTEIDDDGTDSSTWPNRLEYKYKPAAGTAKLTGYFNEYGELRVISGKSNTVAFRIFGRNAPTDSAHTGNVFEIQDNRTDRNVKVGIDETGNITTTGTLQTTGAITRAVPSGPTLATGYVIINVTDTVPPTNTPANTLVLKKRS